MKANQSNISVGDTVIFQCDEFRYGMMKEFDGTVQEVTEKGVEVIYLSGYRSRNDFIPFSYIFAKVDESQPIVTLKYAPYRGHFVEFTAHEEESHD